MAGLEKCEGTEEWTNKFKKLLFMERKNVLKTTETIKEAQRYSMDISTDLQNILKERNIPHPGDTPKTKNVFKQESKENSFVNMDFPRNRVHFKDIKTTHTMVDDTFMESYEARSRKQDISDESFEAMEKMCDKTASDPDSTLFQYLHCDNKREVMEATKKRRSAQPSYCDADDESAALNKLLSDLRNEDQQQLADESPLKGVEMTQIEDIEAPSRFWDNTVLQTSPVKMVGLLRPSTILEECADDSEVSSAQTSYKSAVKALTSEVSSSCYETASETASFYNPLKSVSTEADPLHIVKSEGTGEVDPLSLENELGNEVNETLNLIELEKTMAACNTSLNSAPVIHLVQETYKEELNVSKSESDESVIELLSDEENPLSPFSNHNAMLDNNSATPSSNAQTTLIKWDTPFNVKKENLSLSFNNSADMTPNSTKESPEGRQNSLHFNDTLEEVEYMMKKGMEMIEADKIANESHSTGNTAPSTPNVLREKQNTFTITPAMDKNQHKLPFVGSHEKRSEPSPKRTPIPKSAQKSADRFALNIKPMPKLDLFKKPTSACKPTNPATRHKDLFAHVVSPIGTYMKKTTVTPLMTTMKKNTDTHNSTAFRELEYESRLYQPKFNLQSSLGNAKVLKSPNARTLPKKAYISSELRQVTDERSPVTIPGGKKIQKYLDAAIMPVVIRHDGKAKISGSNSKLPAKLQKTGGSSNNTPKRQENDMSLANLSVMSGDVSVYTIKDAQKL